MIKPYIFKGYRIGFTSNFEVFKSLFMWHNETSNTWSHILGALMFVWFLIYVACFMNLPQMPALGNEFCATLSSGNNTFVEYIE